MDSETENTIRDILTGAKITVQEVIRLLLEGNSSAAELSQEVRNALTLIKQVLDRESLEVGALQSLAPRGQSAQGINVSMVQHVGASQNHAVAAHDRTLAAYDHAQAPHDHAQAARDHAAHDHAQAARDHAAHDHAQAARDRNTVTMTNNSQANERVGSTPVRTDQPFALSANASGMQQAAGSARWGIPASSSSNISSTLPPRQRIEDDDIPPSSGVRRNGVTSTQATSSLRGAHVESSSAQATPPIHRSAFVPQGSSSSAVASGPNAQPQPKPSAAYMASHQQSVAAANSSSRKAPASGAYSQATPPSLFQARVHPSRTFSAPHKYMRSSKPKTMKWCGPCDTQHKCDYICRPCPVEACTGRLQGGKNPSCAVCKNMKDCCRVCPDRHRIDKKRAPCVSCPNCKRGIIVQGMGCNECDFTPPPTTSKRLRSHHTELYEDEEEDDYHAQDGYDEDLTEPDPVESGRRLEWRDEDDISHSVSTAHENSPLEADGPLLEATWRSKPAHRQVEAQRERNGSDLGLCQRRSEEPHEVIVIDDPGPVLRADSREEPREVIVINDDDEDFFCLVCFGELTLSNSVLCGAGHGTCSDCFAEWAKKRAALGKPAICPKCRALMEKPVRPRN